MAVENKKKVERREEEKKVRFCSRNSIKNFPGSNLIFFILYRCYKIYMGFFLLLRVKLMKELDLLLFKLERGEFIQEKENVLFFE